MIDQLEVLPRPPQAGRFSFERLLFLSLVAIFSWAVTATLIAVLGVFSGWLTLLVSFGVSVAVAWRLPFVFGPDSATRETRSWVLWIVVALVIAWSVLGLGNPGEHLRTGRDDGTYLATAGWLVRSGELLVDARIGPFADADDLEFGVPGFYDLREDGRLTPQFLHAFPAMMATVGDIAGLKAMLAVNVALGALGLFLVFALAARLAGRGPALVAVLMVGMSAIFLYFTRAPYSEPLAMVFFLGGAWLVLLASSARSPSLWIFAGMVLGATCLARIDGLVLLIPVVGFSVISRACDLPTESEWRGLVRGFLASLLVVVIDLAVIVPMYAGQLRSQLLPIIAAVVGLLLVGLLPKEWFRWTQLKLRSHRQTLAIAALVGGGLLLAYASFIRPEVVTVRGNPYGLAGLQEAAGLEVDPTRNYAEMSVRWLSWYLGPAALTVGFIGLGISMWKVTTGRRLPNVALWLTMTVLFTFGYLWRPSINPDHIWAMRRFLPVVLPGLAIGAAILVSAIARNKTTASYLSSVVVALSVVVGLLPGFLDIIGLHELAGLSTDFVSACESLGPDATVLIIDAGGQGVGSRSAQSFRSYCGLPSARSGTSPPTPDRIRQLAAAWATEGRQLFVVTPPDEMPQGLKVAREFDLFPGQYRVLEMTLLRRPETTFSVDLRLHAAEIEPE